ncbi:MAG TPA: aldo/keto reductase [Candidatus Paceibacterota bacterium]
MDATMLNTGARMPSMGLGTWRSREDSASAVHTALECGYKHIDCAWIYRNEAEIGDVFAARFSNDSSREAIFITGKLWNSFHHRENVEKACKESLLNLRLDYLDLYLMHWGIATPYMTGEEIVRAGTTELLDEGGVLITEPVSIRETWEAMEALVDAGFVKAIGVSNFTATMLIDLLSYARIKPAVNQIELHPYLQQSALVEFCRFHGIAITAYSPLGSPGNYGNTDLPTPSMDPVVNGIAKNHKKSPQQIMIRWAMERGTTPIPKSVTPARIQENIAVFDFELSENEMRAIKKIDKHLRFVDPYAWWKIPYFS